MTSEVFNYRSEEGMKQYPDLFFDLAVVDPPYGIGVNQMNMGGRKTVKPTGKKWDNKVPGPEYFTELMRVSKHQIIFGGNYFVLRPSPCFIIWDKAETMYGRSFAECEYAWCSMDASARIYKMSPNQLERIHPTQKPVELYSWIYYNFLPEGGRVLDTHLGSGTNRIAADKARNIDFTAYETDKNFYRWP